MCDPLDVVALVLLDQSREFQLLPRKREPDDAQEQQNVLAHGAQVERTPRGCVRHRLAVALPCVRESAVASRPGNVVDAAADPERCKKQLDAPEQLVGLASQTDVPRSVRLIHGTAIGIEQAPQERPLDLLRRLEDAPGDLLRRGTTGFRSEGFEETGERPTAEPKLDGPVLLLTGLRSSATVDPREQPEMPRQDLLLILVRAV